MLCTIVDIRGDYAFVKYEETGVISIAHSGKLKRYADTELLKNTLKSFYWQDMIG